MDDPSMRIALYIIWGLLAAFFFLVSLWGLLERWSGKQKAQNPGDFLQQGIFVLVCVLISVAIDQYILTDLVASLSPDWIPIGFYEVLLLPLVLLIGAKIVGPSKDLTITKNPRPTEKRHR